MTRLRPTLSHLFFTDDLVIFSKADLEHDRLLKKLLKVFCVVFGHKVNDSKTNMFFSKGVEESLTDVICLTFGFQKVNYLGLYFGIPLFHKSVTNSTLQFIVEKVRRKLQS